MAALPIRGFGMVIEKVSQHLSLQESDIWKEGLKTLQKSKTKNIHIHQNILRQSFSYQMILTLRIK